MPNRMNDVTQVFSRASGDSAEGYAGSQAFQDQMIHGFSQMSAGENPTSLIQAQGELMKRGWGPKTSSEFLKNALGHLEQAAQYKNLNAVQKENAAQPEFMKTVTPDPRERDSMEQGGFDPNENPTLSKMMPGQPEKPLSQNQAMRIMGPGKAWDNPSQVGSFMEVPQRQQLLNEQASQQKSQRRIEEMTADQQERDRPLNDFAMAQALGVTPDQYEQLTNRPYPLTRTPQTLESLGIGGDVGAPEPTTAPTPNPNVGITRNAKGQMTIRVNPERQAQGAQNRIFAEYEREQKALGRTAAEIREGWQTILRANAAATAGGGQEGQLGVRQTQPYLQNQRDIATTRAVGGQQGQLAVQSGQPYIDNQRNINTARSEGTAAGSPLETSTQKEITGLEGALRQIDNIEKTYNENFLGPIKGTAGAFELRRRAGGMINSPLGESETIFRESLKDVSDQLLRARSGAAINESEYTRLNAMLPQATDEPQVFAAGLKRFKTEMSNMVSRKAQLGKTPKGAASGGGQSGDISPEGKILVNPTTGEKIMKQKGQWVPIP